LKQYEGIPVDFAVYRIMYQLFDKGVLDDPRKDNVKGDVRTKEHADLSDEIAKQSMVLLKNNDNALPLIDRHVHLHLVGDQLSNPVIAGGGSGSVHEKSIKSPLDAMCDRMYIPHFNSTNQTCSVKQCDRWGHTCITFTPFKDNNGGNPYRGCEQNDDHYDATIMAAGMESSEGADRQDLFWDQNTLQAANFVKNLTHPGRKIAHLVAPGPSIIDFDEVFDAILYSVMPGQREAEALTSIVFGD
jgi:hypothetical protein